MTFIYPAVLTPHKENEGYHVTFPDLDARQTARIFRTRWRTPEQQLMTGSAWNWRKTTRICRR